ncbi:Rhs family protein [Hahella chejuensis KCTC 2396]|uniref:Rhs family protein n=2 Tax=Hahella chejuensis TaxID=158327 RepID=Q2SIG5_HAHCH|nr:Rhs family protein [Hahella chejuensis KCTC 2396]
MFEVNSVVKAVFMRLFNYAAFVVCLAVVCLQTASAEPGVFLLKQEPDYKADFVLEEQDLYVKTLGDGVRLTRTYRPGKGWTWNARWADLEFIKQEVKVKFANNSSGGGGSIDFDPKPLELEGEAAGLSGYKKWGKIRRFDTDYERVAGMARFGGDSAHIVPVTGGYEWRNRKGDWIKYNEEGKTLSYGDIANQYTLNRDGQGRIESVVDKFNQTLYHIKYSGDSRAPSSVTDYSGREVYYDYVDGELQSVKDVRGYEWRYVYHSGKLSQRIDPNGNATSYEFDDNRLEKIILANGDATSYKYEYLKNISINQKENAEFYKITKKLPDGTVEEVKVRNAPKPTGIGFLSTDKGSSAPVSSGQGVLLTSATDQLLEKKRNEKLLYEREVNGELVNKIVYDTKNKIRTVTRYGETTEYVEDVWGNKTEIRYQDGRKETAKYHAAFNLPLERIDPKGVKHSYSYDGGARLTSYTQSGETESRSFTYSYSDTKRTASIGGATYTENLDTYGNAKSVVNPEGNVSTYTYNALGQAITETRPEGGVYTYSYDDAGNLLSIEDPLKRVTSFEYDPAGNLIKTTLPNTGEVRYGYNKLNEQTSVTSHYGSVFKSEYNHNNRVLTFTDALGNQSLIRKTPHGQIDYQRDANGNETVYFFDDFLVKEAEYPTFTQQIDYDKSRWAAAVTNKFDGQEQRSNFERDSIGRVSNLTDAESNSTQFEYDVFGRVVKSTDAEQGVTQLAYDGWDNLIKLIDPENRVTGFTYDKNNQVKSERRFPDGVNAVTRFYFYDENGNLIKEITPNGQKIFYHYDLADQLEKIEYFATEIAVAPEQVTTFTYNSLGQIETYGDGDTSGQYRYNLMGQLIESTINYGPFSKTIKYSYDKNGRVRTYTNPENVTYSYGYDPKGQIQTINIPGEGLLTFNRYSWNQPTQITLPGGMTINRVYDGLQRVKENQLDDPANNPIARVTLGYDSVGNITSQSTEHGDYQYSYDKLYRLIDADYPESDAFNLQDESFEYDGVSNRVAHTILARPEREELEYNEANQLIRQGDTYYHYDHNGHLISKSIDKNGDHPTYKYIYNNKERLIRVEAGGDGIVASYGYNPFGHRMWKEVDGLKTYFLYNHSGMVGEYDSFGALIKEYHYTPGNTWMTSPLFQRAGENTYYYQNDHLGAPRQMASRNGQIVWKAAYEVFGRVKIFVDKAENNLRFPGQYFDQESGMHHNYFRDYNPGYGRYIQRDPISVYGGINVYAYANGNPVVYMDPLGLAKMNVGVGGSVPILGGFSLGLFGTDGDGDGGCHMDVGLFFQANKPMDGYSKKGGKVMSGKGLPGWFVGKFKIGEQIGISRGGRGSVVQLGAEVSVGIAGIGGNIGINADNKTNTPDSIAIEGGVLFAIGAEETVNFSVSVADMARLAAAIISWDFDQQIFGVPKGGSCECSN